MFVFVACPLAPQAWLQDQIVPRLRTIFPRNEQLQSKWKQRAQQRLLTSFCNLRIREVRAPLEGAVALLLCGSAVFVCTVSSVFSCSNPSVCMPAVLQSNEAVQHHSRFPRLRKRHPRLPNRTCMCTCTCPPSSLLLPLPRCTHVLHSRRVRS